jgi:hypothetical protein
VRDAEATLLSKRPKTGATNHPDQLSVAAIGSVIYFFFLSFSQISSKMLCSSSEERFVKSPVKGMKHLFLLALVPFRYTMFGFLEHEMASETRTFLFVVS